MTRMLVSLRLAVFLSPVLLLAPAAGGAEPSDWFHPAVALEDENGLIDRGATVGHVGPSVVDLDGDGRRDLVLGDFSGYFYFYRNIGTDAEPRYAAPVYLMAGDERARVPIYCCMGSHPQLVDFDGDGILDLLSGSYDPGEVYLFRGLGGGRFAARETIVDKQGNPVLFAPEADQESASFGTLVAVVDWDDDGDLDLVLGGKSGAIRVRLNEGTREQPRFATENIEVHIAGEPLRVPGRHAAPVVADWDGDGRWDLLSGDGRGGVYWFRNIGPVGAPAFAPAVELLPPFVGNAFEIFVEAGSPPLPGIRSQIAVVDYNGNGKLDLLVGDYSATISLREDLTDEERGQFEAARRAVDAAWAELQDVNKQVNAELEKWLATVPLAERERVAALPDEEQENEPLCLEFDRRYKEAERRYDVESKRSAHVRTRESFERSYSNAIGRHLGNSAKDRGYVWLYLRK